MPSDLVEGSERRGRDNLQGIFTFYKVEVEMSPCIAATNRLLDREGLEGRRSEERVVKHRDERSRPGFTPPASAHAPPWTTRTFPLLLLFVLFLESFREREREFEREREIERERDRERDRDRYRDRDRD